MKRDGDWLCLNGIWNFSVEDGEGHTVRKGEIVVPYSPEAPLSGVSHILQPSETLIYERDIVWPYPYDKDNEILFLHFGAVDYETEILINGEKVLVHRGGYLPFSLSVPSESFHLTLRVKDPTDEGEQERGKQKLGKGGIWYTPQSGIWQTVWMEKTGKYHIRQLHTVPDEKGFSITVDTSGGGDGRLVIGTRELVFSSGVPLRVDIENPRTWSPEDPFLYEFTLSYHSDRVSSYTGLRRFSVEKDENGKERLFLNGKSYFHHGLLDQGYYKGGLYTPESEEEMVNDILLAKRMGFNMLRKHVKIESARWYYNCDRLGILVWQDMPSGGRKYSFPVISLPLFFGSHLSDSRHNLPGRKNGEMKREFEEHLMEMTDALGSFVSIAMWVVFNEAWGQFDSVRLGRMVEKKDPSRPVDYHSGWLDQKKGSFLSRHVYFRPYTYRNDRYSRCVILTEFGGYGLDLTHGSSPEKKFSYRGFRTEKELTDAVIAMYRRDIFPAKRKGLSASVYTQLSDVEGELNGLVTFDRRQIKADEKRMKEMGDELIRY